MSKEALTLVHAKKGYRTESYGGSGIRDVVEVIRHEFSMGNTDILDFLQNEYGILLNYSLTKEESAELTTFEELQAQQSEMIQENAPDIAEEILHFVEETLQVAQPALCTLWLGNEADVIERYNGGETTGLDTYSFADVPYVVLSDLHADGVLFVFNRTMVPDSNHPETVFLSNLGKNTQNRLCGVH